MCASKKVKHNRNRSLLSIFCAIKNFKVDSEHVEIVIFNQKYGRG